MHYEYDGICLSPLKHRVQVDVTRDLRRFIESGLSISTSLHTPDESQYRVLRFIYKPIYIITFIY